MEINPYLHFNGNCEEAFHFYAKCLNGKIEAMLTHEGMPAEQQASPEWQKKMLHARLNVNGEIIMGSDAPPEYFQAPAGFSVSIQLKDPAEAERIFNAMSENGTVKMPFAQTFWAYRFGMFIDKYGIPWMVNCDQQ